MGIAFAGRRLNEIPKEVIMIAVRVEI